MLQSLKSIFFKKSNVSIDNKNVQSDLSVSLSANIKSEQTKQTLPITSFIKTIKKQKNDS